MFYFHLLTFFKIKFLQINHPGPPLDCQTVWIQIKTDILLVLIWVQTVCYWQTTKFSACMQRAITGKDFSVQYISPWPAHFLLFSANQMQEKDHIQLGIFCITHTFVRLIPITWWEEIAVQNVNFTKFIFIFRTLNKTVIRILTQKDVNFKC